MGPCAQVRLLASLHLCLFYHLDAAFVVCCEGAIQLVLRYFSEGIIPHVAVDLVHLWEEMNSGSSYVSIGQSKLPLFLHISK